MSAERLRGVHAATVCPMRDDFGIDEAALAAHVASVSAVPGIEGLLINGHAGENWLLDRAETRRVIAVVREAIGPGVFLTSGINAESSLEAARRAADAEAAGADAVLVFPPNGWGLFQDEGAALLHHRHVAAATGLPILLYQAPVGAGRMPYPPALLAELASGPRVIGVKEGSWEVAAFEASRRAVKAVRPDVAVLGSGDEHLMTSWLVGSEGSQVSLAAIVPEAVVALWQATQAEDWTEARRWHGVLYPLAVAIYRAAPGGRATSRLKACLRMLGRIPGETVRPPLVPLGDAEHSRLLAALLHAGTPVAALTGIDDVVC
jgi:4-hydroxy-tetrahydrodipicolinate synthase